MRAHYDWVDLERDAKTGIETLQAHFEGHAYDLHWHDSYLVGATRQGVQQFRCRGGTHQSTPGYVFMLEPGEIHDGDAPAHGGFTYQTLYLDAHWLDAALEPLVGARGCNEVIGFTDTLVRDARLAARISAVVCALRDEPAAIVRQATLDSMLEALARRTQRKPYTGRIPRLTPTVQRARDFMHANIGADIDLSDLETVTGVDRFRLSRAFKKAYGLAPHAYLVQLRLARARARLASGETPVEVAAALGFADQSHMGRWFRRVYGVTPAVYRQRSNLPD